jgi:hypothetical protein
MSIWRYPVRQRGMGPEMAPPRKEKNMKYLLMICGDEKMWADMSEAQRSAEHAEYGKFGAAIKKSGNYVAGQALQPTSTATTVRVRDGKTLTTHGPFAETREQLGGFYLVEARDLDEATAMAARIPSARTGCVEVRPILDVG